MEPYVIAEPVYYYPKINIPPVTLVVVIICAIVFICINAGKRGSKTDRAIKCGAFSRSRIKNGQWWRVLTVGFVHIDIWHVLMNLYALYSMSSLETMFGSVKFAIILLCSVVGGSLFQLLLSKTELAVGLSGGLYGLMVITFILLAVNGGMHSVVRFIPTIIINLVMNFLPHIGWQAHLGGAVTGAVLYFLLISGG